MAGRASKADKLGTVDHSKIEYAPFRRSFYIETQELAKMKEEEVAAYRMELDDIKVCRADRTPCLHGWLRVGFSLQIVTTSQQVWGRRI